MELKSDVGCKTMGSSLGMKSSRDPTTPFSLKIKGFIWKHQAVCSGTAKALPCVGRADIPQGERPGPSACLKHRCPCPGWSSCCS